MGDYFVAMTESKQELLEVLAAVGELSEIEGDEKSKIASSCYAGMKWPICVAEVCALLCK